MKKKKVLMATIAAASLALSCGAFAACGHSHTYSKEWDKDATGHWHYATCDDLKEGDAKYKKDFAEHVWGDDDICDICNYKNNAPGGDPVSSVTLDKTELKLGLGNLEAELTATVAGGGAVKWSSDNEAVVAVNEDTGYVEAFKPGAATITATAENGDIATCEVVVEDGYYIIGGMDSAWNKAGVFGDSNVIYFMPTETEGIYKTKSFELRKNGNFQVALVGITADNWWEKAFNGNYIATDDTVLSKNDGGNIAVEKHGMYTITLDLTGDKAVVSGVCDQEIDDSNVENIYYIIGLDQNPWTPAETEDDVIDGRAFTKDEDGTYSLTIELTKGWEFKVVVVGMGYDGEMGESALPRALIGANGTATVNTDYQLTWTSSTNIGVGVSGKYTFTLNPEGGTNNKLTYTFEATDATEDPNDPTAQVIHYYIKGSKVTNWQNIASSEYELTETEEGSGVYSLTIELEAGGEFMFISCEGNGNAQKDYYNNGNTTLTNVGDCVTIQGANYLTGEAGWYTVTLDPTNGTVEISYSATNPAEAE